MDLNITTSNSSHNYTGITLQTSADSSVAILLYDDADCHRLGLQALLNASSLCKQLPSTLGEISIRFPKFFHDGDVRHYNSHSSTPI